MLKEKGQDFQAVISHPTYALPFLNPGRLVEVKDGDVEFGWGIVVAYNKIINPKVSRSHMSRVLESDLMSQGRPPVVTESDPPQKHYVVDVLIKVASDSVIEKKTTSSGISPPPPGDSGRVVIIGIILTTVQAISQLRVKLPQDLRSQEQKNTAFKAVGEIKKRMPDGPALLDPIKNMGINDKSFRDLIKVSGCPSGC